MKIIIISHNKVLKEEILQSLKSIDMHRHVLVFDERLDDLDQFVQEEHPHLIIIDSACLKDNSLNSLEQICLSYLNIAVIVLTENASSEFLMAAMRSGVKDVLKLPLVSNDLLASVGRVESKLKPVEVVKKKGKVIVFIASKGGSGATFLACNLGYIMAATNDEKVALLDLNLQFGDAALFVSDQVPSNTLADVASNITRLDASLLASSMVQILPNFSVLAAPEDAESAQDVKPEHIEALLRLTKAQYDFVVVDIGRTLNATSVKALDQADYIFVVLQETLPFIRDTKRLVSALQSLGYAKDKIHLLINRYEKGGDIQLEDVEATLGMKIYKTIPNSYQAVSASVNQGVPIMKISKHNPVTIAIEDMSDHLVQHHRDRKSGWLASLLHHA